MSRAMNIALPEAEVAAICAKAGVRVSDIETLPAGGTHLVLVTSEDAQDMRDKFKKHLIEGRVKRFSFYHARR